MLSAAGILLVTALTIGQPGDGISLLPNPEVQHPGRAGVSGPPARPVTSPPRAVAAAVAAATAGAAVAARRRGMPTSPLVVFVPGYGSGSADDTFGGLMGRIGLPEARLESFSWADDGDFHRLGSQHVTAAEAAERLEERLRQLAGGRPLYVVGHSKGGVAIAEMVAGWDADPSSRISGVVGAAILDPPIASGALGTAQRLGFGWGLLPDNGLFSPDRFVDDEVVDVRRHLGQASGVDVIVIRNPDAGVTSFHDEPPGLRIYDLDDGGPPSWIYLLTGGLLGLFGALKRTVDAHNSVLHNDDVAACIRAEVRRLGTCSWTAGAVHGS